MKFVDVPRSDNVPDYFKRLQNDYNSDSDSPGDYPCLMIRSVNKLSEPCFLEANIEGRVMNMEIDSGSSVSVISRYDYRKYLAHISPKTSKRKLIVVNGSTLEILGSILVRVLINDKQAQVELIVLNCEHRFIPLMGRDWLDNFCSDWRKHFSNIFSINSVLPQVRVDNTLNEIDLKYKTVFDKDISTPIAGFEADLVLREDIPIFKKAYQVPYRLKDKVNNYLINLKRNKIITSFKTSLWASPVIVVMKKDKAFKDCKLQLLKANFLTLYDPEKTIIVCADASSYGLGGVIAHLIDGKERPISFTSFSLNSTQKSDLSFNSQYFIHFLERQRVRVIKSPPYHPQSNGQAARLVRVTKEVSKKFLLDPETRNLSLQDKLDYFLFNYRNTCLTEGGDFPSERVFNYKPKTLLDLTNPNKHYKQMLQQNTADNTENYPQFEKSITDPFAKLVAGDKVYYKNHKLNETQKWVEAKFIKRLSTNIFQISIGSVLVSAHRGQIRLTGKSERRRNVAFQMVDQAAQSRGTKRRRNDSEDDEPFYGFPLGLEMLPPTRSEVHPKVFRSSKQQDVGVSSCSNRRKSTSILRRSARAAKKKFEKDYVYFK